MYSLADLEAQDHHIRIGEAFVRNQRRIIAERTALGLPTTKDQHWLCVFLNGLARHKMRRTEILAHLGRDAEEEVPSAGVIQSVTRFSPVQGPRADQHRGMAAA